jgi:hypothetical protein
MRFVESDHSHKENKINVPYSFNKQIKCEGVELYQKEYQISVSYRYCLP